jgi:hypothetical protein
MAALLLGIKPQIGLYIEQASAVDQEAASKRDRNVLTYHTLNTYVRPVSFLHVLYPELLKKRNVIYAEGLDLIPYIRYVMAVYVFKVTPTLFETRS